MTCHREASRLRKQKQRMAAKLQKMSPEVVTDLFEAAMKDPPALPPPSRSPTPMTALLSSGAPQRHGSSPGSPSPARQENSQASQPQATGSHENRGL